MQKFYTKPKIAKHCCELVREHVDIEYAKDCVIEPSAGNGAFIQGLQQMCKNTIFIDIKPDNNLITKQNYLTYHHTDKSKYRKTHVIGNPPFGFKGSMAIKFFKKSAQFADSISFILPLSFAKKSMQHSVPLQFHLKHSWILPQNAFKFHNKDVHIPSVFQIWEHRNTLRKKPAKVVANGYHYVKDPMHADIAIRRVGSNAGKIYKDSITRNVNSHYFIKLDKLEHKKILENKGIIKNTAKNYVTGALSISKKDMTKALNNIMLNLSK
jgi:predicted RNA methylase